MGGLIGAFGGGAVAGEISDAIMSTVIEDDANKMVKIIEEVFLSLASAYLLTQREVEHVIDHLGESLTGNNLKDMFASDNRSAFAEQLILPYVEREINRRNRIYLLDNGSMQYGLRLLLEDMSDAEEALVFE